MRRIASLVAVLSLLLGLVIFLPHSVHAAGGPLLPGESLINGVPSFDFGTNDGVNWDPQYNMDVAPDGPVIQGDLKAAGIPISRVWFFQNSLVDNHAMSDAEQLQKLAAVQASGMLCFANFPTANSVSYDLHLLSILGGKCPYVEVMNEPDIEGVNSTAYLAFWNSFVPQARSQFPGILFGGPADYDNQGNECTYYNDGTSACFLQKVMMGMKASGNLPDFVTYHWYPCWNNTAAQCLALAGSFNSAAQQVIDWATQIFGKPMPVICSEWNADPGSPNFMFDRTWDAQYVTAATQNIETSGLSGAMEFDTSSYGNYAADDLFDIYSGGAPFATFTAYAAELARVRGGGPTPTTTPTTPTPVPPTPTITNTPTPSPTNTPTPSPTPSPTPGGSLSLVQSKSVFTNQQASTKLAFAQAVQSGDLLVAGIGVGGGNTYSVKSVTDSLGDTWTRAVTGVNGDNSEADIWYTTSKSSGTDTVTASLSGSGFVQTVLSLGEFSGPGSVLQSKAAASSGTAHAVSVSGTLVVGVYVDAGYNSSITLSGTKLGSVYQNTDQDEGAMEMGDSFTTSSSTYAEVAAVAFG